MINPFFHTIGVLRCDRSSPDFVGSGVLLRIEGKDYIATAAHVVDELPDEVALAVVKDEIHGCKDQPSRIFASKQPDGSYREGLDLALLSVTHNYREFVTEEGMSFFDLERNTPPPVTDACIVSGFPTKMNYFDFRKRRYAPSCGCCHIQSFMSAPERVRIIGGDPEFHFALEMKKRGDFVNGHNNQPIPELFDLHGMSGGGVWHIERSHEIDLPACATGIAGIIIEDRDTKNDRKGMAKVVKIETIRNVIEFAKSCSETQFFVQ